MVPFKALPLPNPPTLTSEQARKIGKIGKQNSPWSKKPSSCTSNAKVVFAANQRLRLIAAIVKKKQGT